MNSCLQPCVNNNNHLGLLLDQPIIADLLLRCMKSEDSNKGAVPVKH